MLLFLILHAPCVKGSTQIFLEGVSNHYGVEQWIGIQSKMEQYYSMEIAMYCWKSLPFLQALQEFSRLAKK